MVSPRHLPNAYRTLLQTRQMQIVKNAEGRILRLGVHRFWSLSIVSYSKKTPFWKLDLFPSSGERELKR
jgi:hypothetical protein